MSLRGGVLPPKQSPHVSGIASGKNKNALAMTFENKKALQKEDFFVSSGGLEPSTNGLKGHCSAIELRAHL